MRADLRRTCVLGMGCYGAFPGLKCAADSVRGRPDGLALMLSVELCSLHMQPDDSAETVVSCALFSDGASMALISARHAARARRGDRRRGHRLRLHDAGTHVVQPDRPRLSDVPVELRAGTAERAGSGLRRAAAGRARPGRAPTCACGASTPAAPRLSITCRRELHLSDAQVDVSHGVLHDYGNMSSATILFVLERIVECQQPQPGDYGVLLAFGPGLTMEGLLLRW